MTEASAENSQELIADFVDEGINSLTDLPAQIEAQLRDPSSADPINAVFRAVHSIKGCAGFLGLVAIKQFSHSLENTLDEVRKQKLPLTEELARHFVQGFDLLSEMLQRASDGEVDPELNAAESELLAAIERSTSTARTDVEPESLLLEEIERLATDIRAASAPDAQQWADRIESLVREFRGQEAVELESQETPAAPVKRPQPKAFCGVRCECGGHDVTKHVEALVGLFLAVDAGQFSESRATQFLTAADEFAAWADEHSQPELAAALRTSKRNLETILNSPLDIDSGLLGIVWDALVPQLARLLPATAADSPHAAPTDGDKQLSASTNDNGKPADEKKAAKQRMLRIREESIDHFFDKVSQLFISCELFKDLHLRMVGSGAVPQLVEEMQQINREFIAQSAALRQSVVTLRQVPISGLFAKFPRMARSLAGQLGKKIDVHTSGDEVEVDKSLVEDLDAPLTHMVRNVVDHGIETPAERAARGVGESGNLWLKAEKTRTHLVITVQDDGRGIDPSRLRRKAVEKGVLTEAQAAALTDEQATELIYHAGFSTAEKVSEVSGRGVGMDVVRTNLREHNGDIFVSSKLGVGTTFRLEIPNREAVVVVDALMLRQSNCNFALPFSFIREITDLAADSLKPVFGSMQMATIRGEIYDAVSLAAILKLEQTPRVPGEPVPAIVVTCKQGSLCLLVDAVLNHRQVVINGVRHLFPGLDTISGVAQLGGGRLALVLSVPEIIKNLEELRKSDGARAVGSLRTIPAMLSAASAASPLERLGDARSTKGAAPCDEALSV